MELKIYIFKTTVENKKMDLKPVKIRIFKDQQREKSSAVLMFLKCCALFLFNYRVIMFIFYLHFIQKHFPPL